MFIVLAVSRSVQTTLLLLTKVMFLVLTPLSVRNGLTEFQNVLVSVMLSKLML